MSTDQVILLEEPTLEFRYGQTIRAPHQGLSLFGPFDADAPTRPGTITHGVIGTSDGITALREFLKRLQRPIYDVYDDPVVIKKSQFIWPTFPGLEVAFACHWPSEAGWKKEIKSEALQALLNHMDPYKRAYDICNHYLEAIKDAAGRDERLSTIICVIPDTIWEACRPKSRVSGGIGDRPSISEVEIRRIQPDLFENYKSEQYDFSVDFRRQLKARAMEFGIPLQLVRESTLRLHDLAGLPGRELTPLSDRAWNLSVALYYKAGGKPWRLTTARDGVCYIGLAFRRTERAKDPNTACCAAQMFLDTGDGIVFRGEFGPWYSPEHKQFEIGRTEAKGLLSGVLETYKKQDGRDLREIFIHSRSRISTEEYRGYLEACPQGTKVIGIRVRRDLNTRLFRFGKFPVLRGTMWKISDRTAYLWASGFKPDLLTYDGWEVPVPLRVDLQHGEGDIEQICRDIMGLTKLNYNACKLSDSQPVTVGFSDAVGEILIGNPKIANRRPNFRFYI